ncbi:MAG: DUF935 family protein [Opitutales bacterium]|nr:DUF935 family protein [Opitutales bacterium]
MCKNYSVKDWMRFLETYGMPLRVGKYGPEATADERDILRRAVRGLGVDAAAIVPQSMEIELIREAAGQAGSGASVFQAAADWFDSQVSKAVLGQTMTADSGSSLAQAKVHNEVRLDRVRYDSRKLARTVNRDVVTPFIDLNFGPQKQYPRVYYRVPEPEDIAAWSDALAKLVPVGLRVEASQVRDRLGFADPDTKAEVLSIPTAAPATDLNHAHDCPHCRTAAKALNRATPPAAAPDEIDDIAADHLDGWERQMDPILNPVRRLADEVDTAEEFTRRLPELLAQMDSAALIRHLATAAFKARGQGDATDDA